MNSKGPCDCGSSDGRVTYDDGHSYCFVCRTRGNGVEGAPIGAFEYKTVRSDKVPEGTIEAIKDRGIERRTCSKYGVRVSYDPEGNIEKHQYPWYNSNNDLIGYKTRICKTKEFYCPSGGQGAMLFGQDQCRGRGKYITITEGELDCLSVAQAFETKYDVVSLRNGASSAAKELKAQLEFLESYDNIVLCFDSDKAGKEATATCQDIFSPGKLRIVKLSKKDPNEYIVAGELKNLVSEWWDAKPYSPDGIIRGSDTWALLGEFRNVQSIPYPWTGLNDLTRGIREELVTITSGSGMGKSQFIRELEYYLLGATKHNIGVIALEETAARSVLGIMSIAANRPLHLEEGTPDDELRPFWDQTLGTDRYFLFSDWEDPTVDALLGKIRFMAKANDCKYIVLDHLSIVVSAQENGDERKAIDEVMTRLRRLVAELKIGLFLVSHLKRASGTTHEEGGRISLGELRGSQSIAQLSDIVIGLERDQQHEDPEIRNTTLVRVLKNRYTGETGPACYLKYSRETGRMLEVPKPIELDAANSEF
jgi:twinkle protein